MRGNVSTDAVRALAYQLWQERGGEGGSAEEDWIRAEEILSEDHRALMQDAALDRVASGNERRQATEVLDKAVEESFPASDPPALHLKDEPPVNAGAKWKAAKGATTKSSKRGDATV